MFIRSIFTTVEISATDGKETLAEATNVFTGGIYYAKKRGSSKKTEKTTVTVHEIVKDGTYAQIFGGGNLKRLCLEESQIVAFCRDHRNLLRTEGYGTFFLFKGEDAWFFIAVVDIDDGRLRVDVNDFSRCHVWSASSRHRVIVPQCPNQIAF